jgi:hypothetical protein
LTSGVVERFTEATSTREMRALEAVAARTLDALAERTVWCATASVPAGRAARALRDRLGWAGEYGVIARLLELGRGAETRAVEGVAPDDVVVLHDPAPAGLAEQIRDGGGHALLRVRAGEGGAAARAMDAYVLSWRTSDARGRAVECLAALLPSTLTVAEWDIPFGERGRRQRQDLAWASLLAAVARGDRQETVGGAIHARPLVSVR